VRPAVLTLSWWFRGPGGGELRAPPAGGRAHRLPEERAGRPRTRGPQRHGDYRQQAGRPHHGGNPQDLRRRLRVHAEHDQQGPFQSVPVGFSSNTYCFHLRLLTPRCFPLQDFEEFPEHRTHFFYLLQAATSQCFPAFLSIAPAQFKLILDSIIWAFKHTMRNVADTGRDFDAELTQIKILLLSRFSRKYA